eukprot:CAMPEP_0183305426 /NCGR_PEP_ID=MMETSP0160_2-20130417/10168_1 /TAXON_ID=2839 ORGANISM="Odontella Sinensis, Strain Grunow 1884" /NCGR_SAMPLE_ID=MMETSP0160_2 /ASSEMBLY_ACC=CAM_ASM_000250 /LENGTH=113 /DNA_ID=CAMNT_0025468615 /DNA_START=38 /DNA_END=375 /DNA_ORIENTATION=+
MEICGNHFELACDKMEGEELGRCTKTKKDTSQGNPGGEENVCWTAEDCRLEQVTCANDSSPHEVCGCAALSSGQMSPDQQCMEERKTLGLPCACAMCLAEACDSRFEATCDKT